MASKPSITPRPPPSATVAAFVGQDEDAPRKRPAAQPARRSAGQPASGPGRRTITRADGRELRKQTVYLPADLARRLAIHAAAEGLELSAIVADALERYLPPED